LRKKGSTDIDANVYHSLQEAFGIIEPDTNTKIEGKIQSTFVDFFLVGYGCKVVTPTVTTDAATDILQEQATPNGSLTDDGAEACACGFEWGLTDAYDNTTPTDSKVAGESFSQVINGLSPGTIYHFRAFATNSAGTGYGADRTFTTAPIPSNRAHALSREEL